MTRMDTEHTPLVYTLEIVSHLINIIPILYAYNNRRIDAMLANLNSAVSSAIYHACALGLLINNELFNRVRESDYSCVVIFLFVVMLMVFRVIPHYKLPPNIEMATTVPIEEYRRLYTAYQNGNIVRWLYLMLIGLFFWAGWIGFDTKLYSIVLFPMLAFIAFLQYVYLRQPISMKGKYVLCSALLTMVAGLVVFYLAGNPGDPWYGILHPIWHMLIDASYFQFLIWVQIQDDEPWFPDIGIVNDVWYLLTMEKRGELKKKN
jgi:hypothetical protein